MSIDILTTLQMMLPGSSLEVELTMQDGSTTKMALDVEKIHAELQEAKELAAKAADLEKEANWLAIKCQKFCSVFSEQHFCDECPHDATEDCPGAVGGVLNAHEINEWRMAARLAREAEA